MEHVATVRSENAYCGMLPSESVEMNLTVDQFHMHCISP